MANRTAPLPRASAAIDGKLIAIWFGDVETQTHAFGAKADRYSVQIPTRAPDVWHWAVPNQATNYGPDALLASLRYPKHNVRTIAKESARHWRDKMAADERKAAQRRKAATYTELLPLVPDYDEQGIDAGIRYRQRA